LLDASRAGRPTPAEPYVARSLGRHDEATGLNTSTNLPVTGVHCPPADLAESAYGLNVCVMPGTAVTGFVKSSVGNAPPPTLVCWPSAASKALAVRDGNFSATDATIMIEPQELSEVADGDETPMLFMS